MAGIAENRKVRCAVIGCGWWASTAHLPALRDHPGAELVAVQRPERDQAERIAADFGAAHACTTVEEVLAVEGLEAVVISSVPIAHYEQAKTALQCGMHVLVEKPMAITAAQARELVDIAKQKGLHFLISCPWHYTAHGIEARRLIQSGALGDLKMVSVLMTNFTMGLYEGQSWEKVFGRNPTMQNSAEPYLKPGRNSYSDPAVSGGGQIYCQVSHAAAYLGYLIGSAPTEVFARFDNSGTAVDVYDTLNLKLANGTIVSLASTGATMYSRRNYEVRVYGTTGMLQLELWDGKMELHDLDCNVTKYPDLAEEDIYPMFAPTNNFIETIAGREPNRSPATLGMYAMEVIEAACQSARENRNVIVS